MQNLTDVRIWEVCLYYKIVHHFPLLRVSVRNTDVRIHRTSPALRAIVPWVAFYPRDSGNVLRSQNLLSPAVKSWKDISSRWPLRTQPGFANRGRFLPAAAHASSCCCSCDLRWASPCKVAKHEKMCKATRPLDIRWLWIPKLPGSAGQTRKFPVRGPERRKIPRTRDLAQG